MGYKLKILSPVHIGCGEQYNGLNFILDESKVFVIESYTITKLLGAENSLTFAKWLEENADDIASLDVKHREERKRDRNSDATKKLSRELRLKKQSFTLKKFFEQNKMTSMEQLKKHSLYSLACQTGFYNDSEFYPFIKQMHKPYIPGTEIKGAVRTAILYCALQDDKKIQEWLKQELEAFSFKHGQDIKLVANKKNLKEENPFKPKQKLSKLKETLEKQMHETSKRLQELFFNYKPDAKYDVMKFLYIGDSELLNAKTLVVSYAKPYNMSGNPFTLFYEYMQPDTNMSLSSFALENEKNRAIKLNKMGFSEGHKQLMSSLDFILTKCQRFSADLLQEEISYYSQHGKSDIVKHLQEIQKQNTPESPVLRIGKDEGYSSLTVGLAIKKLMPELYENVLIHATKNKSYDSNHGGPFPKSRKIVHWNGKELTAGWVKLIPDTQTSPQQTERRNEPSKNEPNTKVDLSSLQALQEKFRGGK